MTPERQYLTTEAFVNIARACFVFAIAENDPDEFVATAIGLREAIGIPKAAEAIADFILGLDAQQLLWVQKNTGMGVTHV